MVMITIASPVMAAHLGGCRDAGDMRGRAVSMLTDYHGETLLEAIEDADRDLAAYYGREPYQQEDDDPAWAVAFCEIAPCLQKAIRRDRITFDKLGRPTVTG